MMPEREPAMLGAGSAAQPDTRADGAAAAVESSTSSQQRDHSRPAPGRSSRGAPTFYVVGFWRRAAQACIDGVILLPVIALVIWLSSAITGVSLPPSRHRGPDIWLDLFLGAEPALWGAIGLAIAVAVVYAFVFQATWGRTPGMRIVRARVIDLYGDPPSVARAGARTAAYLAGLATLGLGFAWIGFDSEKRGLHDWLSGTYVVKE